MISGGICFHSVSSGMQLAEKVEFGYPALPLEMFLAFAMSCKLVWGSPAGIILHMLRDLEICFELFETRMIYYH